jgi:hypothetical protein
MTLWRLSEAAFGSPGSGDEHKTGKRLAALGRAVVYAVISWSVLKYALGEGTKSSDKQSVDLTATLLKYRAGRSLVVVIGLALIGGGVYLAYSAWKEKFRKDLEFGQAGTRVRRIVEWLGKFGGMARGAVFVTAGIFLVVAAVQAKPQQAKGVDSALRTLASTPLGPWLLVLVAIGLIMFGCSRSARPSGGACDRSEAVLGGLQGVELGVLAAQREQVGVHALLDDLPVAQHVDPVRVPDAGQPVGDEQHAAARGVPRMELNRAYSARASRAASARP